MRKSTNSKKSRRGSPNSVRDTSPIQHKSQDAVLALKSMLSIPTPAKDQEVEDSVSALKAMLARPVPAKNEEPVVPVDRPKVEAVLALKSLLLSPAQPEAVAQKSITESLESLKFMLKSSKAGEIENDSDKSSKSDSSQKNKAKEQTPSRTKKKNKEKSGSSGKVPFASSQYLNSPDPLSLPLPDFDEVQSSFFADTFVDVVLPSSSPPVR